MSSSTLFPEGQLRGERLLSQSVALTERRRRWMGASRPEVIRSTILVRSNSLVRFGSVTLASDTRNTTGRWSETRFNIFIYGPFFRHDEIVRGTRSPSDNRQRPPIAPRRQQGLPP